MGKIAHLDVSAVFEAIHLGSEILGIYEDVGVL